MDLRESPAFVSHTARSQVEGFPRGLETCHCVLERKKEKRQRVRQRGVYLGRRGAQQTLPVSREERNNQQKIKREQPPESERQRQQEVAEEIKKLPKKRNAS